MKKQKVKFKMYKINDIHEFSGVVYRVAYINHGTAYLAPMDDIEYPLFYCCVAIKLDQYGNVTTL